MTTVGDSGPGKPIGEIVGAIGRGAVVRLTKLSASIRLAGARVLDLAGAQRSSGGDLAAMSVRGRGFGAGSQARGVLSSWDVKNVQFAASGRFGGVVLGWVMGDMVAIDDVVIPISGSEFQSVSALEAEGALPGARFGIPDDRQGQLVLVSIPGSDEMNRLDVWRGAKCERKLDGWTRHFLVG